MRFPRKVREVSTDSLRAFEEMRWIGFCPAPSEPHGCPYIVSLSKGNPPLHALAGPQTQGACINASALHSFTLTSLCLGHVHAYVLLPLLLLHAAGALGLFPACIIDEGGANGLFALLCLSLSPPRLPSLSLRLSKEVLQVGSLHLGMS